MLKCNKCVFLLDFISLRESKFPEWLSFLEVNLQIMNTIITQDAPINHRLLFANVGSFQPLYIACLRPGNKAGIIPIGLFRCCAVPEEDATN